MRKENKIVEKYRNMKKKGIIFMLFTIGVVLTICSFVYKDYRKENNQTKDINSGNIATISAGLVKNLIQEGLEDIDIIPDKRNTGYQGSNKLMMVDGAGVFHGIEYKMSGGGRIALDLYYNNTSLGNKIVIENCDFSANPFILLNDGEVEEEKQVIFNNCVFSSVISNRGDSKVKYYFNYCSLESFSGSNSEFDSCYFGGTYKDALNPLRNILLENCFIADMSHYLESGTLHTDGTQIWGYKNIDAENITYTNCRFEIPTTKISNNNSYVNSCISVCMGESNGKNIAFKNCIVNGGGFSIYVTVTEPYRLENVTFEKIRIGCAGRWGDFYPSNSKEGVTYKEISNTSSLYVSSLWRQEDGELHFYVSNDTNQNRTLAVVTKGGIEFFDIPSCPTYEEQNDNMPFEQFPFDIEIISKYKSDYIICYDVTSEDAKQIRFKNWTTEPVVFDKNKLIRKTD